MRSADADYAGYLVDRKSNSGMVYFLGSSLTSCGSMKQNSFSLSIAEAKNMDVASCCAQLLWDQSSMNDFGIVTYTIPMIYDNKNALNMVKNPVQHKRTKHIDVRHHFLRDNVEKGAICIKIFKI